MDQTQATTQSLEKQLQTDFQKGLTTAQVKQRIAKDGLNNVKKKIGHSFLYIFLQQFNNPLTYLLLGSGTLLFFVGNTFDAYIIFGILLLNAVIGSFQEIRIGLIFDKLQKFKKLETVVMRDGARKVVDSSQLVVGDIIILQQGEKIPADAVVVKGFNATVDQAILTGESQAVHKKEGDALLSGSYVLSGYITAVVTAIGKRTRLGHIQETIETVSTDMPLQNDLSELLDFILKIIIVICFVLLIIGLVMGKQFSELLAALLALFICVVPQGLPVIMTVVLVSGAYQMARRKIFAKRLQAIEALGRADILLLDKTGTLTCNQLMVVEIILESQTYRVTGSGYNPEGKVMQGEQIIMYQTASQEVRQMMQAAVLLNHSEVFYDSATQFYSIKGSPLEAALNVLSKKMGIKHEELFSDFICTNEIPFTAASQMHTAVFNHQNKLISFRVGAPEAVIKQCKDVTQTQQEQLQVMFKKGLRVIAVAVSDRLIGFFGLQDVLRKQASAIIKTIQTAGVKVMMVTGDNKDTAFHLAQQAGIIHNENQLVDGQDFREKSKDQLLQLLSTTTVFARMLPENKLLLVQLLQQQGFIVAMVGDGINDAPALAAANLGIVMGSSGADIAKEASDIVLLDDSFESILVGLEQGRHIFNSFKRAIVYFFTTNLSEVMIMLCAFAVNLPLPLIAAQILWLNLVTDGFFDFALAMEPYQKGLLRPQWSGNDSKSLITQDLILKIVVQAALMTLVAFLLFLYHYQTDLVLARTVVVTTLTTCYWFSALSSRSSELCLFEIGFFSNKWLVISLMIVFLVLMTMLYTTWGNFIFQTVPLSWCQWRLILAIGTSILFLQEIKKYFFRAY
jgi:magnesium-transporting ATPase (P-type)